MTLNRFRNWFVFAASSVVLASSALAAPAIKNVVLVHGAFVDGSGWQPVYDILTKDGYHVTLVQEPLTSLEEDVAATRRVLDQQDGPTILVAHSYGGTVITEAGTYPKVAALVFIAAHAPDVGETEAGNGKKFPNSSQTADQDTGRLCISRSRQLPGRLRCRPAARAGRVHGALADAHCG